MLAQVQVFCPGPGPDLNGTGPGLDLTWDLEWDLEWDLDLSLTMFLLGPPFPESLFLGTSGSCQIRRVGASKQGAGL